ncbi:MAG: 30S ribosomal protein S6 [Chloroflexi bacterium]|nr:30S ribosomal protein S6 [Chloroflexota bacterium]
MRDYELMVVLDPNLDEAAIEAANARVSGAITQRGGTVQGVEAWGRRRLAYPVGRFRDGHYVLYRFQLAAQSTAEIERMLKLTESVMRYLVVRAVHVGGDPRFMQQQNNQATQQPSQASAAGAGSTRAVAEDEPGPEQAPREAVAAAG